ncbi:hypothetical protein LRAMOSA02583 [Lichtheimia ramosa]|uniref:Uncharacterized protein n=1 Tax=Lichtheimia ramosa TaxID=688394 RepID=A0A077WQL2_9FUNG|nr:hypothetical protein LRAMOSA02583 [Lichtheimia ramosa]
MMGSSSIGVLGDQIIIDEPPNGAAFHAGATIDIRYRVQFNGMASLNSAAVSIAEVDSKKVVSVFPNATWVRTADGPRSAHDEWQIPYNMPNGSYNMLVTGL